MSEWERQPGETSRAYAAFCSYRDLGPRRSLAAAYRARKPGSLDERAPGHWCEWSTRFRWVERAAAYDAFLDEQRREQKERALRELEERRFLFELRNQERLERRVERQETVLAQFEEAAAVDVTTRDIKLGGYARLVAETNQTARQAIVGVRSERPPKKDGNDEPGLVRGEFVWVPPSGEK